MPIVNIPDKVCPHCDGTHWYTRTTKDGVLIQICSIKRNEYNKKWRDRFPEKHKVIGKRSRDKRKHTDEYKRKNVERAVKWNKANPEKSKLYIKAALLRHKKRYKEMSKETDKRFRETLHDSYMIRLIRGNTPSLYLPDIPQELIDLKRKQILLKRQIS
jgi:hypothetical protein